MLQRSVGLCCDTFSQSTNDMFDDYFDINVWFEGVFEVSRSIRCWLGFLQARYLVHEKDVTCDFQLASELASTVSEFKEMRETPGINCGILSGVFMPRIRNNNELL